MLLTRQTLVVGSQAQVRLVITGSFGSDWLSAQPLLGSQGFVLKFHVPGGTFSFLAIAWSATISDLINVGGDVGRAGAGAGAWAWQRRSAERDAQRQSTRRSAEVESGGSLRPGRRRHAAAAAVPMAT